MFADVNDLPAQPGGTSPHVVVNSIENVELSEVDFHHLSRVRRVRDGDLVSATDGAGSWRWCVVAGSTLVSAGEVHTVKRPAQSLAVGFALVKGNKPELVVQKLTEIGIDTIIPFVAERSVVRWDDAKTDRQTKRLETIAREASMQSRRFWLPQVLPVTRYQDLIQEESVVRADRDGQPLTSEHRTVLIGPEGGWSAVEQESTGTVGLGSSVLRSETAAIVAGTLMIALRDRRLS
ncbi:MAG: RsmE family RNA methyltransferase [Acidimicrobiales bacterium]